MSLNDDWLARMPAQERCIECGSARPAPPFPEYRHCRIRNRKDVHDYVRTLSTETHEWLLGLYLDNGFNLLAVDTIERGGISSVCVDQCKIILRGVRLKAAGFVIVHNHPSGIAKPSSADARMAQQLRRLSEYYDCILFDSFIVAGEEMIEIGLW